MKSLFAVAVLALSAPTLFAEDKPAPAPAVKPVGEDRVIITETTPSTTTTTTTTTVVEESHTVVEYEDQRPTRKFVRFWTNTVGGTIGGGLKKGAGKVESAF